MIKEALQYIVGLSRPELVEAGGNIYSDRPLKRVCHNPKAEPIKMSTLTGLVDYIRAGIDQMSERMIVQVVSPLEVRLISQLDDDRIRETVVSVKAQVPEFEYGAYMGHEKFIIALQAKFLNTEDRGKLLSFAGTVENGSVTEYGDDGVTQKATVRTGVAGKKDDIVPNPVLLTPYRTFIEVEQPESSFIFRMKEGQGGCIMCAIFEADGGAWKNNAMENIRGYLADELEEFPQFTVIS